MTVAGGADPDGGDPAGAEGSSRLRTVFRLVSASGARVERPDRLDARSRAKAMVPSLFTVTNMLCGFTSLRAAQDGNLDLAAILIGVAVVFDIFDGAMARAVGAITPFGVQFDSLADLISFGVAPAFLLYSWSLNDLGALGWALSSFWLACAAFRLGRFNVTIDPLSDKRYFIGMPSPGAAGLVMASVFASDGDFSGWTRLAPVALAVVPPALMASSFRFPSFRWLASPRPDRIWITVVTVVALVVGLIFVPVGTFLFIAYTYLALAPLGAITRPVRRHFFGADAVAPPRHYQPSVFFLVPRPEAEETPADAADATSGVGGDAE